LQDKPAILILKKGKTRLAESERQANYEVNADTRRIYFID